MLVQNLTRYFFFFNETATPGNNTRSLRDPLPSSIASLRVSGGKIVAIRRASIVFPVPGGPGRKRLWPPAAATSIAAMMPRSEEHTSELHHANISYAVFCLKKKKQLARNHDTEIDV